MLVRIRQFVRDNHSVLPFRSIAELSEKYLRAYYNEDFYNGQRNGEQRAIDICVEGSTSDRHPLVFLDVGAHAGSWSDYVLSRAPIAKLYSFEIVTEIRAGLQRKYRDQQNVHVMDFGLSSSEGHTDVTYNRTHHSTNAIVPHLDSRLFQHDNISIERERIETGDAFMRKEALDHIDFLKIDIEGHEVEVLKGFAETLDSDASPRVIQFEYGETYLTYPHTLREVYDILTPHGYSIGRVFPRTIQFKRYEPADDHFRMGNYLAVKENDPLLDRYRARR